MGRLLGLATLGKRRRRGDAAGASVPYFAELAEKYRNKDLLEEAKAVCEQGLEAWPSYVSGHIVMAKVHRDSGALDRAGVSARKALELDPINAVALSLMGDIALRCGRWEEASRCLEDALFFSPMDAHAAELLKLARQRTRPPVVASPMQAPSEPTPAPPAQPQPSAPPQVEREPETDAEKELSALRQMPGIEGALLLTAEGLPVSGSLGRGNEADEDIAALAAGVVGEWARSDQMPPASPQGLALLEADGGQLVLATAEGWILLVAVSGHMRLGRVLGNIRQVVDHIDGSRN